MAAIAAEDIKESKLMLFVFGELFNAIEECGIPCDELKDLMSFRFDFTFFSKSGTTLAETIFIRPVRNVAMIFFVNIFINMINVV